MLDMSTTYQLYRSRWVSFILVGINSSAVLKDFPFVTFEYTKSVNLKITESSEFYTNRVYHIFKMIPSYYFTIQNFYNFGNTCIGAKVNA